MTGPSVTTVRRATPADAAAVSQLVHELAAEDGGIDQVQATPEHWAAILAREDVLILLAERDAAMLGYVSAARRLNLWLASDILAVDDVYVRPTGRNAGVGGQLMTALAQFAAAQADGEKAPLIRWELRADNHAAARFYSRLGARLQAKQIAVWSPEAYTRTTNPATRTESAGI